MRVEVFSFRVMSEVHVAEKHLADAVARISSKTVRVARSGYDDEGFVELELRVEADSEVDARLATTEALGRWLGGPGAGWSVETVPAPWA